MPFLPTANNVCGLYPFSPERETCCRLYVRATFAFLSFHLRTASRSLAHHHLLFFLVTRLLNSLICLIPLQFLWNCTDLPIPKEFAPSANQRFTALRTFRCTPQRHKKRQEKFLPLFRCLKENYPDFRSDCLKES